MHPRCASTLISILLALTSCQSDRTATREPPNLQPTIVFVKMEYDDGVNVARFIMMNPSFCRILAKSTYLDIHYVGARSGLLPPDLFKWSMG